MEFELLCQQVTEARKQRGDDPRATLPDYVYTEQAAGNTNVQNEKENGSQTDSEHHPMDVSNKDLLNTTEQSDAPLDTSTISTRNSAKRAKINTSQRSTITRRQAKEKDLVNGHNEVRSRRKFCSFNIFLFFRKLFFPLKILNQQLLLMIHLLQRIIHKNL